ncbi:MAG: sodium:solute symporter family transporter, partial [Kiritimatiellia bacterium]
MINHPRRVILFLSLLLIPLTGTVSGAVSRDLRPEAYFNATVVDAEFDGFAAGRAYAMEGARMFAIGGRDADGNLLNGVQILEKQGEAWVLSKATLSTPVAYAGAVGHAGKVYLVGGLTPDGVSARVTALSWDGAALTETELSPMPQPRMLPSVATHRSTTKTYLYVLGGISSPDAAGALASVYEMRLNDVKSGKAAWTRMDDMPQGGRVGAVVTETYNELVVAGGWSLQPDRSLTVSDETWGFARVARDGHVDPGWERRTPMPEPVACAAYAKTGQAHLTILGGTAGAFTLDDLLAGREPSALRDGIWAFHDPTDSWAKLGATPEPVVSGLFLSITGDEYLLAGERTAEGSPFKGWLLDFVRNTKPMKGIDYAVIAVYFLIVAAIGAWFARKQNSAEEFALGNRKVKWWAAAISMFASGVSTISFMALPALTACIGLASTGPAIFMLAGVIVSAFLTYPLLRRLNITSTFEYLERRYGLPLRLFGSFLGIVGQLMGRIGIVVMLPALAVSTMTGIDPWKAGLLIGV